MPQIRKAVSIFVLGLSSQTALAYEIQSASLDQFQGKGIDGSIEVLSTSYFKATNDRTSAANILSLRPDFYSSGRFFEARAQLEGYTYLNSSTSFTPEAPNLYLATSSNFSNLHQLTVGRRVFQWSVADDHWKLGTFSPRFMWDPLRPETVGLTGVTYQYRSSAFTLRLFGSPISIPERGVPITAANGQLSSANPDWQQPYASVGIMNQNVPINYSIQMPAMQALLVHPSALAYTRVGDAHEGPWMSATAGIKPINPADLTAAATMNIQPSPYIDARIVPRVVMHKLGTVEAGYQNSDWSTWGSVSRELPMPDTLADGFAGNPMGPTWIGSTGLDFTGISRLRLSTSALWIQEDSPELPVNSIPISGLPPRYQYTRAVNFKADWNANSAFLSSVNFTRDLLDQNAWVSLDTSYRFGRGHFQIGLGADFFVNSTSDRTLGPYTDNDRLRGKLVYDF